MCVKCAVITQCAVITSTMRGHNIIHTLWNVVNIYDTDSNCDSEYKWNDCTGWRSAVLMCYLPPGESMEFRKERWQWNAFIVMTKTRSRRSCVKWTAIKSWTITNISSGQSRACTRITCTRRHWRIQPSVLGEANRGAVRDHSHDTWPGC